MEFFLAIFSKKPEYHLDQDPPREGWIKGIILLELAPWLLIHCSIINEYHHLRIHSTGFKQTLEISEIFTIKILVIAATDLTWIFSLAAEVKTPPLLFI